MRLLFPVLCLVIAGFLIVVAGLRIATELRAGEDLDLASLLASGVGLLVLILLTLSSDRWLRRRRGGGRPRKDRMTADD